MSSYTTMILTCRAYDDWQECVPSLNRMLTAAGYSIFEKAHPDDAVFTLVGNYLPVLTITEMVETIPWHGASAVQLWHRGEHDNKFTEVDLKLTRLDVKHVQEWSPCADGDYDEFSGTYGKWETKRLERIVLPEEERK